MQRFERVRFGRSGRVNKFVPKHRVNERVPFDQARHKFRIIDAARPRIKPCQKFIESVHVFIRLSRTQPRGSWPTGARLPIQPRLHRVNERVPFDQARHKFRIIDAARPRIKPCQKFIESVHVFIRLSVFALPAQTSRRLRALLLDRAAVRINRVGLLCHCWISICFE